MKLSEAKTFRDRPLAIDKSGKQKRILAKQPKGKWYKRRTIFAAFAIAFLIFAPIIKINGNPFMLFDIANRKFYLFSHLIWAQDTYVLALIMSITVIGVVMFTVIYGRLFCGWACPQTIFLEHVFRRIEYLFDGNYRKKSKKQSSIFRTIAKHVAFFLTSFIIAHIFLNWFLGLDRLIELVTSPIKENVLGFSILMGITTFYYWIYAHFREQVCTMICPYGRMQGVLLDSKSISVIYDYKRGEPRGVKAEGDCINCHQCISVCPTGIDIKNGSQLECINCTACIDECNSVMRKIGKPEDLIRYNSVEGVESGKRNLLNARTYAYSAVLLILIVVLGTVLSKRTTIDSTILRVPGTIYQEVDQEYISNIYNIKIINKTNQEKELSLQLIEPKEGFIQFAGTDNVVKKDEKMEKVLIIKLRRDLLKTRSTKVIIGIYAKDELLETYETNFLGPTN